MFVAPAKTASKTTLTLQQNETSGFGRVEW
jgi:hypothetical protein